MMNPAELKDLAAVLTGIADRKPWQMRSSENVEWGLASDCADPMDVIKAGFQIRLKPWEENRPRLLTLDEIVMLASSVFANVTVKIAEKHTHRKLNAKERNVVASDNSEAFIICT